MSRFPLKKFFQKYVRESLHSKYELKELETIYGKPNGLFDSNLQRSVYKYMGFNQYGLMRDDLRHETPVVLEALKRLPDHIQDERVFRIVRAGYLCFKKEVLPKEEWMTLEKDVLYLTPIIEQIKKEQKEKEDWENN